MQNITTPTLVIRGHRDRVFSRQAFEKVPQIIPGAEDFDVGASGHLVMLERRDAVNRALKNFVASQFMSHTLVGSKVPENAQQ